jgi:hypothetical protein
METNKKDLFRDFMVPLHEITVEQDEAEALGAFVEDALSEEEARESAID